jgi:hypothetical protein
LGRIFMIRPVKDWRMVLVISEQMRATRAEDRNRVAARTGLCPACVLVEPAL